MKDTGFGARKSLASAVPSAAKPRGLSRSEATLARNLLADKQIDTEAWFPSQGRYREVTSCSNTTDFQARRLGIRFRSESGLETPHTLNGTVVTDRALLAILENFQGEVPDALKRFGAPDTVTR